ncbi:MAG: hypothetical protein ACI90V_007149 [Bacillariaceae sp.]
MLFNETTPEQIQEAFSGLPFIVNYAHYFSIIIRPLIMTTFFAILPQIFKALANFGSGATSVQEAERHALSYYWWFMLVWAFGLTTLSTLVINSFQTNDVTLMRAQAILTELGNGVPKQISWYWTAWIIQQNLMILPFMYFLQFNNFLFTALKWDCGARATAGG